MRSVWLVAKAFCVAAWGHRHQRDKAGKRYIWHLVRVAWIAYGLTGDADAAVCGLLHDFFEDVDPSLGARIGRQFGLRVLWTIEALTHNDGTSYEKYIGKIIHSGQRLAQAVKLADLLDNTRPGRRPYPANFTESNAVFNKVCCYQWAIERLTEVRSHGAPQCYHWPQSWCSGHSKE